MASDSESGSSSSSYSSGSPTPPPKKKSPEPKRKSSLPSKEKASKRQRSRDRSPVRASRKARSSPRRQLSVERSSRKSPERSRKRSLDRSNKSSEQKSREIKEDKKLSDGKPTKQKKSKSQTSEIKPGVNKREAEDSLSKPRSRPTEKRIIEDVKIEAFADESKSDRRVIEDQSAFPKVDRQEKSIHDRLGARRHDSQRIDFNDGLNRSVHDRLGSLNDDCELSSAGGLRSMAVVATGESKLHLFDPTSVPKGRFFDHDDRTEFTGGFNRDRGDRNEDRRRRNDERGRRGDRRSDKRERSPLRGLVSDRLEWMARPQRRSWNRRGGFDEPKWQHDMFIEYNNDGGANTKGSQKAKETDDAYGSDMEDEDKKLLQKALAD